jgi:hypothetical protein
MDFEVKTPKPSCFPIAADRMATAPTLTKTAKTTTQKHGATAPPTTGRLTTKQESRCDSDLQCFAKKHAPEASKACEKPVEQLAKSDFRWINSWYEARFDQIRWKNQRAGIVTYIGDKIEYRDNLAHWVRHAYECDFDGVTRRVLDVRAEPSPSLVGVR